MTEQEAKQLEVDIEWNGRANVCVHCGRVPETFYIVTGHDHTDDEIRWCLCRKPITPKKSQRIAELLKEMPLINDAYDRIRAEQVFAIDDIEYDMFSTGWKSAVDLATDNLTSHLAELQSTIAEREAEIVKLMKALSIYAEEWNSHWKIGMPILEPISNEALSAQFTPTTLPELIEKVEKMTIARCATAVGLEDSYQDDGFKAKCKAVEQIHDLPTGQIKLEELL